MKKATTFLVILLMFKVSAQITDFKHIDFTRAENTAKLLKGESLENLPLLTHQLTSKLHTDAEKFRAIYYWVCHNIQNDYGAFLKIKRKRRKYKNNPTAFMNWHQQYKKKVFQKLLTKQKTVCTGYAYLIKQMAFIAGIECKMIDGYGRNTTTHIDSLEAPNHTWNTVKLNNKWYLCDATWSSGYTNEDFTFLKNYNDGYFLTPPSLFAKNHYPIVKKWLFLRNKTPEDFVTGPIVYDTTFEYQIIPNSPQNLYLETVKNSYLSFEFATLQHIDIEKISLVYYTTNNREVKLKISDIAYKNNLLRFNAKFSKKGIYDIHFKINGEIMASYAIYVEKV